VLGERISEDRQSTRAWEQGAAGERWLGRSLEELREQGCVVLHDRRIPNSWANIDHIVVSRAGVYVIDAKNYEGKVVVVDKGNFLRRDWRLYVGGRNRTKILESMPRQVEAVAGALSDVHLPVPPTPVVCFAQSTSGSYFRKFKLNGILIVPPKKLRAMLMADGPLTPDQVLAAGRALRYNLRSA
jgi:hypothetical protein